MSIIYSYPEQGALNANDMLIGTSAEKVGGKQKNITRNFSIQQIADFVNGGTGAVFDGANHLCLNAFLRKLWATERERDRERKRKRKRLRTEFLHKATAKTLKSWRQSLQTVKNDLAQRLI